MSILSSQEQRHESTQLAHVLDGIGVPRPGGRGRPRKRPDHLIGDKLQLPGLLAAAAPPWHPVRHWRAVGLAGLVAWPPTKLWSGALPRPQRGRAVRQPAQAVAWDRDRYDKRALNYRAGVVIASLVLWLGA